MTGNRLPQLPSRPDERAALVYLAQLAAHVVASVSSPCEREHVPPTLPESFETWHVATVQLIDALKRVQSFDKLGRVEQDKLAEDASRLRGSVEALKRAVALAITQ